MFFYYKAGKLVPKPKKEHNMSPLTKQSNIREAVRCWMKKTKQNTILAELCVFSTIFILKKYIKSNFPAASLFLHSI